MYLRASFFNREILQLFFNLLFHMLSDDVNIARLEVGVYSVTELCTRLRINFNMAGVRCRLFTLTVR